MKILFITSRNIINTCGELRLIKNRSEVLFEQFGIATDFLVYTNKKKINPEEINANGKMYIYKYNLYNPIQTVFCYKKFCVAIETAIQSQAYCAVIVSGSSILPCINNIKKVNPKLTTFADIHGAYEELVEFSAKSKIKTIMRHRLYRITKRFERLYLKTFNYILVVSNSMKKYLIDEYGIDEKKVNIVPCSIKHIHLDYFQIAQYRKSARVKYGISEEEKLFIYSGGTSKWQCIEETVHIFQQLCASSKGLKYKLLILSANAAYISKFEGERIITDSLKSDEVPYILPAGDFAFLIRDDLITNKVAYPNKFLEYIMAGLKVITTFYVNDIADVVINKQLGYVLNSVNYEQSLSDYIIHAKNFGDDFDARQSVIDDVCFEKRLSFMKKVCEKK